MILLETVKEDRFRKSVFFFGCRVDPDAECGDRVTFDTKQAQLGKGCLWSRRTATCTG